LNRFIWTEVRKISQTETGYENGIGSILRTAVRRFWPDILPISTPTGTRLNRSTDYQPVWVVQWPASWAGGAVLPAN